MEAPVPRTYSSRISVNLSIVTDDKTDRLCKQPVVTGIHRARIRRERGTGHEGLDHGPVHRIPPARLLIGFKGFDMPDYMGDSISRIKPFYLRPVRIYNKRAKASDERQRGSGTLPG